MDAETQLWIVVGTLLVLSGIQWYRVFRVDRVVHPPVEKPAEETPLPAKEPTHARLV